MAITGTFSYDSTTNGAGRIDNTFKTLSSVAFEGECVLVSGTSARLNGSGSFTNCLIWINNPASASSGTTWSLESADITYTRTKILFNILPTNDHRTSVLLGNLQDVQIGREIGGTSQRFFIYTGGDLVNVEFENIYVHEVQTAWTIFSNVSYLNTELGMLNWNRGRLDRFGINIPSTVSGYVSWIGDNTGNQFWDWNPVNYDDTKLIIDSRYGYGSKAQYVGYTASWKFVNISNTAVENALLVYRDDRSSVGGALVERGRYTTNSSGYLTGTINSQNLSSGSDIQRETLFVLRRQSRQTSGTFTIAGYTDPPGGWNYVMDTVTHQIEVRSYLHEFPGFISNVTSQIGLLNADQTVNLYRDFFLFEDEGVTETNTTTVLGYSGISHSSNAFTLSGTLNLSQVYDSRKLYWRNNDGQTVPLKDGAIADFGDINITFSGSTASPAATEKYTHYTTTGTIDLVTAGTYTTPATVPATGTVTVGDDLSNLATWTFAPGATINLRSGATAASVIVASTIGITAGPGVDLRVAGNQIEISGIPDVPGAVLAIQNLDTLAISYPALIDGGATVELISGINYRLMADAPGYLRQEVTIPGNTPTFTFTLADYRSLYDSGVSLDAQISFDYNNFEVVVSYSPGVNYSFANIFRTIEDYLSTEAGVLFPDPPYPVVVDLGGNNGRNYMFFPYSNSNSTPNPVRIKPDPNNSEDPTITDFVIILEGSEAPLFDIFDFSEAGGRSIRFQTEAVSGSGGGLGPEDIARLERIEQQLTADYFKGADRYQRYLPGTETVILDKDVTLDADGFRVTEHQE